jgi:hypothetical protein
MSGWEPPLPVDAAAGDIAAALGDRLNAVVMAEPGAGKTTRLPAPSHRGAMAPGRKHRHAGAATAGGPRCRPLLKL